MGLRQRANLTLYLDQSPDTVLSASVSLEAKGFVAPKESGGKITQVALKNRLCSKLLTIACREMASWSIDLLYIMLPSVLHF